LESRMRFSFLSFLLTELQAVISDAGGATQPMHTMRGKTIL